jgi:hypothetical protein
MALKTYVVVNPREIPGGVHILDVGGKRYYEGDELKETNALINDGSIAWLIENELIEDK